MPISSLNCKLFEGSSYFYLSVTDAHVGGTLDGKKGSKMEKVISYFKTLKTWLRNVHEESLVLALAAIFQ